MLKSEYARIRAEQHEQGIWQWDDITALRGKTRVLLIFSPSPAKTPYKRTLDSLWDALADPDSGEFAKLQTVQTVVILHSGRPPKEFPHLTPKEAQSARNKFRVSASDFAVVLLGSDLIEQKRWTDAVTLTELP